MRRAGHDHVIATEDASGKVFYAPGSDGSSAELHFPVSELIVDAAEYRERFELDPEVSESSIRGTFSIRHSDFGMRPFRAAIRLLRVADDIDIHLDIVAVIKAR